MPQKYIVSIVNLPKNDEIVLPHPIICVHKECD